MSVMFTLQQALGWLDGARLVGDGATAITRVHTDTRSLQPGDLFVALRGERFDANDMLGEALAAGAAAVLAHAGRIPAGAWVLMRTDWSHRWSGQRDGEAYQNFDETGQHTPGPSTEAVRFLVEERDVLGFGSEAIGTDAGQGYHLRPPYPCHSLMHGAGKYGLQCLKNLDQLPPTGAVIIAAPLKIQGGSGSPLRVLALVS